MKLSGEVDLRKRARRKWLVVLTCAVAAGGWYAKQQLTPEKAIAAPAEVAATDSPSAFGELAEPFVMPDLSLATVAEPYEPGFHVQVMGLDGLSPAPSEPDTVRLESSGSAEDLVVPVRPMSELLPTRASSVPKPITPGIP